MKGERRRDAEITALQIYSAFAFMSHFWIKQVFISNIDNLRKCSF